MIYWMELAKDNSPETYNAIHKRYVELKVTLTSLGVNLDFSLRRDGMDDMIVCQDFPVVSEKKYLNVGHIHPLMQRPCAVIADAFSKLQNIRIGIFGSSVTWRCSQFSDLDIVVRIDHGCEKDFAEVRTQIGLMMGSLDISTDVVDIKSLDKEERLYEEIVSVAVTIVDNIL